MITFNKEVCATLETATRREWLETNGLGGFASSTLVGMNTRRYHGLLVAALEPPVKRFVLLSKLEETLVLDGARIDLSSNRYPGAIHPQGYQFLARFEKRFFPVATFQVGDWAIHKTVLMPHRKNAVAIEYRFETGSITPTVFEARPLLAYRDYHALTHENSVLNRHVAMEDHCVQFAPYPGLPPLILLHTAGQFIRDGYWYKNFEYVREQERGLDFMEDLFSPGYFSAEVTNGSRVCFLATLEEVDRSPRFSANDFEQIKAQELKRRRQMVGGLKPEDGAPYYLRLAADQFLVRREKDSLTVIAGYPWFTDWGRDTMLSLPGLLFVTKNFAAAREILLTFVRHLRDGLIPNHFPDHPENGEPPEYNTADATLWLFHLVYDLATRTEDLTFVKANLYDALLQSFDRHRKGTLFDIHMTDDGLLWAGAEGVQLTWMDAKVGNWVVTPRHGKAVEICALWCNALRVLEFFSKKFGDKVRAKEFAALASQAQESFNAVFWNPATAYLNDVVNAEGIDISLRPNQLLAISLPFGPLAKEHRKPVVSAVAEHLLTPYGLRTLARSDPHYCGIYRGDQHERDSAYHQGTVWPWLLGPYATAYLKTFTRTVKNKKHVRSLLEPLIQYFLHEGVGQVPEIFDGDVPAIEEASSRPSGKGCFAQAWSVAEIHRVLMEET